MKKIIFLFLIIFNQQSFGQISYSLMPGFPIILDSLEGAYNNGPIIADFNNDGQNEVLVGVNSLSSIGKVILIDNKGVIMPGFPKLVECSISYIWIAAGDLNNDGYLDIIVKSDSLYAFDYKGNRISGFPIYTYITPNDFGDKLALYDLDNDGNIEIILSRKNVMTVVNNNGKIKNGWPITLNQGGNTSISYFAIGDLDNDNIAEIIIPSSNHLYQTPNLDSNKIYILKPDGSQHIISPIISDSGYYFDTFNYPVIFKNGNNTFFSIISNYSPNRTTSNTYKTRFTTYNSNGSIFSRNTFSSIIYNESLTMFINESTQPYFLCSELFYSTALDVYGNILPNYPIFLQANNYRNLNIGKIHNQWCFIGSKRADTTGGLGWRGHVQFYNFESGQPINDVMRPIGGPSTAPNLTDLNNDGQLDVVITTTSVTKEGDGSALYAWTISGVPYSRENFPWPMFNHDRYRTNQYGFIPPDEPVGIQPMNTNVPASYNLYQNFPNPFNPATSIKFDIAKSGNVKLVVFDLLGREVTTLVNEKLNPGTYQVSFDGSSFSSGVYFYSLKFDNKIIGTRTMVLLK